MNETTALHLAKHISSAFPHEVRQLGNGDYVITILHHGKIAFIVWEYDDIARIPSTLRSRYSAPNYQAHNGSLGP